MTTQVIAVVRAYDVNWNTQVRIKMTKLSPALDEQEKFIKDDRNRLEKEMREAEVNWGNFPLRIASQDLIKQHIKKTGTNFVDISYLPVDRSIFDPAKGQPFDRLVHWRRPRDFMQADATKGLLEPQVFDKTIEPSDIL